MGVQTKGDFHNTFVVMNVAAVDLASHGAVASVNTDIAVEALDGEDQAPLLTTDFVLQVILPVTIEAGIAIQHCAVKDTNEVTLRTTNASAGAVDPASIAANAIKFIIGRR